MNTHHQQTIPRLISLDVFRGMTIALMIVVNSPGNSMPYQWLQHSDWNGCTLADLVFPFFIVILGISSALAFSNLRAQNIPLTKLIHKIIQRSLYIFLIGLVLNAFPHHFDFSTLRILGVLQRIAICYFFSSILFLTTRPQTQAMILLILLIGYGFLLTNVSPLGAGVNPLSLKGNIVGYVDRLIFSPGHLYSGTFDPEGLLSTLPAIASALLGNLIGAYLISSRSNKKTAQGLLLTGLILTLMGWFLSITLPLNKALWSSSYVLWTGGIAVIVYSAIYALIENLQWHQWSKPFNLFGRHAILVYVLHVVFLKLQALCQIQDAEGVIINLRLYITKAVFNDFTPQNAALLYATSYTLLWLFVLNRTEKWQQAKNFIAHPVSSSEG